MTGTAADRSDENDEDDDGRAALDQGDNDIAVDLDDEGDVDEDDVDEDDVSARVDDLILLLAPLVEAGWEVSNEFYVEVDPDDGVVVSEILERTWMRLGVEFVPELRRLDLTPAEEEWEVGEEPAFSMLDEVVRIDLTGRYDDDLRAVVRVAGELGLLDATRVRAATEDDEDDVREALSEAYVDWLVGPAAEHRDLDPGQLASELDSDPFFKMIFRFVVRVAGTGVLPDLVPSAAALGVATWCWRNNTAVEDWHVKGDVLMARVNIAVTKAVRPHVHVPDGVEWDAVQAALTDSEWRLHDGVVVAELFREGWPEVCETVTRQIQEWKRLDRDLLGPEATLRLLSIGGSTSYSRHWWGQGRWTGICRRIVTDALAAGLTPPAPYASGDPERLIDDLQDPDNVSDDVLDWLIDLPQQATSKVRGLRYSKATQPIWRTVSLRG